MQRTRPSPPHSDRSSHTRVVNDLVIPEDGEPSKRLRCLTLVYLVALFALAGARRSASLPKPPAPGELVINEIFYDPPASHVEFVELYNRSQRTVDLSTLQISDSRRRPVYLAGDQLTLEPGGLIVLVNDQITFRQDYPDVDVAAARPWPTLNNTGDIVTLTAGDTIIDRVAYAPGWGGDDVSLERVDPAAPSAEAANWEPSTADAGSTPGRHNSVYAPDTSAPRIVFAEQTTPRTVLVHVDEPVAASSLEAAHFSCGEDAHSVDVQLLSDHRRIELRLSAVPEAGECTITRLADRIGNQLTGAAVPLAYRPDPGDLLITEIMYQPEADPFDSRPDQPEYVELFNRSPNRLTVRGLYWTDRPDEHGRTDTTVMGRPHQAVKAGKHAVVFSDPDGREAQGLRAAFPHLPLSVCLLPVHAESLGLRNDGETIRLHRPDGTLIDAVRYTPDWHHPDLADAEGVALERIATDGPSNERSNWSSCADPRGGTPGRVNSLGVHGRHRPDDAVVHIRPSPFSPDGDGMDDHARIEYRLPRPTTSVRARVFDTGGHRIRTLAEVRLGGSSGTIIWDGRDDRMRLVPAGIYIVLIEAVDATMGTVTRHKIPVVLAR